MPHPDPGWYNSAANFTVFSGDNEIQRARA
jgi:hypothetical protein